MEFNKDEAIRAKMLAEQQLAENDIVRAKWFASKAQSLYPKLEGLPQLQELLDVYIASRNTLNGEPDWYKILGVDPLADDEAIRKRYKKSALALHPDKNNYVGADEAFKVLSRAWIVLSDKTRRHEYNSRRNITASYEKARCGNSPAGARKRNYNSFSNSVRSSSSSTPEKDIKAQRTRDGIPSAGAGKSCCNTSSSSSTRNPKIPDKLRTDSLSTRNPKIPDKLQTDSSTHASKPNSFWTSCKTCNTH